MAKELPKYQQRKIMRDAGHPPKARTAERKPWWHPLISQLRPEDYKQLRAHGERPTRD